MIGTECRVFWFCKDCELFINETEIHTTELHECADCKCPFKTYHNKHQFYDSTNIQHKVYKMQLIEVLNRIMHKRMLNKDRTEGESILSVS